MKILKNQKFNGLLLSPKIYVDENLPMSPGKDDIVRIANYYNESSPIGIRNKAIILLLIEYGMRRSEIANLKLHDIDWDKGQGRRI